MEEPDESSIIRTRARTLTDRSCDEGPELDVAGYSRESGTLNAGVSKAGQCVGHRDLRITAMPETSCKYITSSQWVVGRCREGSLTKEQSSDLENAWLAKPELSVSISGGR